MPNLMQIISKLESDPRFGTLTYNEQVELRSKIAAREFGKDPRFNSLPANEQMDLLARAAYRDPVFDSTADRAGNSGIITSQGFREMVPRTKADIEALIKVEESGKAKSIFESISTGKPMLAPTSAGIYSELQSLQAGIFSGGNIIRTLANVAKQVTGATVTDTDVETQNYAKLFEWQRYAKSRDDRTANIGKTSEVIGNLGAIVAETYALGKILQGGPGKLAGLAKIAEVVAGAEKLAKLPHVAHLGIRAAGYAAAGGTINLVRETFGDYVNRAIKDPEIADLTLRSAKYFGEGALYDLAYMGLGGLRRTGIGLRWTFLGTPATAQGEALKGVVRKGALWDNIKASFNNAFVDALTGKGISPLVLDKLNDPYAKTVMNNIEAYGRTLRNIERPDPADFLTAAANANGHIVEQVQGGFKLINMFDPQKPQVVGVFADVDKTIKALAIEAKKLPKIPPSAVGELGLATKKIEVSRTITKALKNGDEEAGKILTNLVAPVGGNFEPDKVRQFSREFLRVNGADPNVFNSISTSIDGDMISIKSGDAIISKIPRSVFDPASEQAAIKGLADGLGGLVTSKEATQAGRALDKSFLATYQSTIRGSQTVYTPAWLDWTVGEWGGSIARGPSGFVLSLPGEAPRTFQGYQELGDFVLKNRMYDDKMLKVYLANFEGMDLLKTQTGYQVKQGKRIIGSAETIPELFEKYPGLTPKIPAQYGPKFNVIIDEAPHITYENGIAVGNRATIIEELSHFKDTTPRKKTFFLNGRLSLDEGSKQFEATFPELGFSKTFKSKKEALNFLRKGAESIDTLEAAAVRKGYMFDVVNGQWELYRKGEVNVFRTKKEMMGYLKSAPVADYQPELTGLEEEFFRDFDMSHLSNEGDQFFRAPIEVKPGGEPFEVPFRWDVQNIVPIRTLEGQLEYATRTKKFGGIIGKILGDKNVKMASSGSEYVLRTFRRIREFNTVFSRKASEVDNVFENIFKINGKSLSPVVEENIGKLMQGNLDAPDIVKTARELGLGVEHIEIARTARATANQMGDIFKVNPDKLLVDYLPRMRKFIQASEMTKFAGENAAERFLYESLGGSGVTDLTPTFKHVRVADIPNMILEKNPRKLLKNYAMMGLKEQHFGRLLDDWSEWFRLNKGKIDPSVATRFTMYLGDFLGLPSGKTEAAIKMATGKLMQKLGFKNPSRNIIDSVMRMGYGSTLAFRPYPALRNLGQPFQMLGFRIGNAWIADAYRELGEATGEEAKAIYQNLVNSGSIPVGLPLHEANEIFGQGGKISKVIQLGLSPIGNGDAFNRAVSYLAVAKRFDWALKGFGVDDVEKFVFKSGAWNLPTDLLDTFKAQIKAGEIGPARHLFASKLTDEAMIVYGRGLGPVSYRGVLGRLFGQYGTFYVNYVQNLRNAFSRAPNLRTKALMVTRYAGTSAAFAGAAAAIGIRYEDWIPGPVTFSGGQYWGLLNHILEGMNLSSYEGRVARAKLIGMHEKDGTIEFDIPSIIKGDLFKAVVPGSIEANSLVRAMEYWNAGDIKRFTLSIMSAPIKRNE